MDLYIFGFLWIYNNNLLENFSSEWLTVSTVYASNKVLWQRKINDLNKILTFRYIWHYDIYPSDILLKILSFVANLLVWALYRKSHRTNYRLKITHLTLFVTYYELRITYNILYRHYWLQITKNIVSYSWACIGTIRDKILLCGT